jgi:hypothetical protein
MYLVTQCGIMFPHNHFMQKNVCVLDTVISVAKISQSYEEFLGNLFMMQLYLYLPLD